MRYQITLACENCGKTLRVTYQPHRDETPEDVRRRSPLIENPMCPCGHRADYPASAALDISLEQ
jgi:hypothetical protein